MPELDRANLQADMVVGRYVRNQAIAAVAAVEMIEAGKACGCRNCTQHAVAEVNSWLLFLAFGAVEPLFGFIPIGNRAKIIDPRDE